jgi:surface protein
MDNMFYRCSSLEELDVSGFKTSKVKDMSGMFDGCSKLVSLDLNNFDTQNVTDMCRMFRGCLKLSTLDVSKFNTSKVTDMSSVFSECESLLEIDVTNWNTSNVTNMSGMFYWTGIRSLDLTHFDVSKVETMKEMFYSNIYLQTIYCNDTWNCQVSEHMFAYCSVLKGAANWGEGKSNDVSYANPGNGYFTYKDYDVWVCGVQVTRNNYNDLSSISSVYGSVKYDPYSNTLILEDATINGNDNIKGGIYSQGKVLNINAVGVNNVSSDNSSAITCSDGSVNITGTGSLSVIGATGVSVLSDSKENSISVSGGVLFSAIGMNAYGIIGKVNNGKYLTTLNISGENTKVRIKGAVQDVLRIKDLVLSDGLMITQPTDAYFSNNSIKNSDGTFVKDEWVEIGLKRYGFEVGGIPVTIMNKDNITGSNIKQGTASYDDETKTLTLTDCVISMDAASGTVGIKSNMDSLAIHPVGNNSIGMVETGIECSRNLTIAGPGKLDMMLCGTGIAMTDKTYKAELAICDDAKLSMVLVGTGIVGTYVDKPGHVFFQKNLRISGGNSDVDIIASQSAVSDMNVLTLNDGIALSAPVGAKYSGGDVLDKDGNLVQNKKVRFSHLGDVNNDGAVTMADANAVVNYFLATDKPSDFDVDNANVNGDGDDDGKPSITMADANAIVNMFLGQ